MFRHARAPSPARIACLGLLLVVGWASNVSAAETVKNPGQQAEQSAEEEDASDERRAADTITWGLPPVDVTAEPGLREEERIGEYEQPRWSTRRRFPTTRVYVRAKGEADFEYWQTVTMPFDDAAGTSIESQYEFEIGLGHRLQLDLYLVALQESTGKPYQIAEQKTELRYALADWGVIWGNPTLYAEYVHNFLGDPTKIEGKVLLGGEVGEGWHAGGNVVFERKFGKDYEQEYALTGGLSRTIVDSVFSLGAEAEVEAKDSKGSRFDFHGYEALAGPSLQVFLKPHSHVDFLALFGAEFEEEGQGDFESTFLFQPTVVVGYEF